MAGRNKKHNINSTDTLSHLIMQVYDAAMDPAYWLRFLESLSDVYGGETMGLLLYDRDNRRSYCNIPLSFVHYVRADPDWIAEFERYYCTINPWMDCFASLPEGTVVSSNSLIADEVFFASEFYNDWLKRKGYRYSLGGQVVQRESLVVSLSGLRAETATSQELELARHLIPHLQRACSLHINMAGSKALAEAGFSVLDRFPMGVVLLDINGKVRFANKSAEAIFRDQNGFFVNKDRYCQASSLMDTVNLQKLIHEAIQTGKGQGLASGGVLALMRTPPRRPLSILVSPINGSGLTVNEGIYAVVFIADPDSGELEPKTDCLQKLYGLTAAQTKLALAMGKGVSVEDYAEQNCLSLNTVRTHLKQLFEKTDTHRQGELVRMLVSCPAFMRHE